MKTVRKTLVLAAVAALLLMLAGCTTVSSVEQAIDDIGTVSLSSSRTLEYAETLYDDLSDRAKLKVSNADELFAARAEYDAMAGLVSEAEEAVGAIGPVTPDSGEAILRARSAYDAAVEAGLERYVSYLESVLNDAEYDYTVACLSVQVTEARNLFAQGRRNEALAQAQAIQEAYPDTPYAEEAMQLTADILMEMADEIYRTSGAGEALYALDQYIWEYGLGLDYCLAQRTAYQQELESIRPANGTILNNTVYSGYGEFTVHASNDSDALVKLESRDDPDDYILFYVRRGDSATVNVNNGSYVVKYTTGNTWHGEERMFGFWASFTQAEGTVDFATTSDGMYVYYSSISITLYAVLGGDLDTYPISEDAF